MEKTWYFFQMMYAVDSSLGAKGRKHRLLPRVLMSLSAALQ